MMREKNMKKNYAKAFKSVILMTVLLALLSVIAVPLSLSRQIRDISVLDQNGQEQMMQWDDMHGEHHVDHEILWRSQVTSLNAANYAILGGIVILWLALGIYYWLLTVAWLYKSAINEGMNQSLWPILGLFTNLLAVFAFLIVRDNPRRATM